MKIYIARFHSPKYEFSASGRTREEAVTLLCDTLAQHAEQYNLVPDWWKGGRDTTSALELIDLSEMMVGVGYRDTTPIVPSKESTAIASLNDAYSRASDIENLFLGETFPCVQIDKEDKTCIRRQSNKPYCEINHNQLCSPCLTYWLAGMIKNTIHTIRCVRARLESKTQVDASTQQAVSP